jgi:hypothetical protein
MRIDFALKRANSRFFTDCYPISAVFAPKLDPNQPAIGSPKQLGAGPGTVNLAFQYQWLVTATRALPTPKKKGPGVEARTLLVVRIVTSFS